MHVVAQDAERASRSDSQAKKNALHEIVDSGTPVGILGYLDDEPVAWCSIAPRDSYRKLGGPDEPVPD